MRTLLILSLFLAACGQEQPQQLVSSPNAAATPTVSPTPAGVGYNTKPYTEPNGTPCTNPGYNGCAVYR